MKEQGHLKVFSYHKAGGLTAIIVAYNRGQAVKLIAREVESRGVIFNKDSKVEEIDLEAEKKGKVIILHNGFGEK